LAGCFNKELNPDCPQKIQAGNANKVIKKVQLLISPKEFSLFLQKKTSRIYIIVMKEFFVVPEEQMRRKS
jgi:hypothetical protein